MDDLDFLFNHYTVLHDGVGVVHASDAIPLSVTLQNGQKYYIERAQDRRVAYAATDANGVRGAHYCSRTDFVMMIKNTGVALVAVLWKTRLPPELLYQLLDEGIIVEAKHSHISRERTWVRFAAQDSAHRRERLRTDLRHVQRDVDGWITDVTYSCTGKELLPGG